MQDLADEFRNLRDAVMDWLSDLDETAVYDFFGPGAWDEIKDFLDNLLGDPGNPVGDFPDLTDPLYASMFPSMSGFLENLLAAFNDADEILAQLYGADGGVIAAKFRRTIATPSFNARSKAASSAIILDIPCPLVE